LETLGFACLVASFAWALWIAHVQGFLGAWIASWFGFGDGWRSGSAERRLLSEHWDDLRSPFWLLVFGVALIAIGKAS
jgi:hypothetical protein